MKNKKIRFIIFLVLSLPKTIFFNLKVFPFRVAIKMPILVGYNIKIINSRRNVISIKTKISPFMIRIGFGGSEVIIPQRYGIINIEGGSLIFHGKATFAAGSVLDCSGNLEIGDHFSTNKNAFISCSKEICIGNNVMLGWNVNIFDAAGHAIYKDGIPKHTQVPIHIGNHVWLCSFSQILKGSIIEDDSIVAWGSVVTKRIDGKNILIAGIPGEKKQEGISWGPFTGV